MKKTANRLTLRAETVRVLSGRGLERVHGGKNVITGPTVSGQPECPTTEGFPGCEPQSQGCSNMCPTGFPSRCSPWPDPS